MRRVPSTPLPAILSAGALLLSTSAAFAQDENPVTRGEYLAQLGGCKHCHTSDESKPYAGEVELSTPFGKLVGPNITPDADYGIGTWSKEDFEGALRRGVNAEGQPLYPAMPYNAFTLLSDEDVDALWAYFRQIEPQPNAVETVQLPFPYNVRQAVAVWQELYFDEGRFEPDPAKSDEINRGEYLADGLVHCAQCHTTRNALGGPIEDKAYQGAQVDGWYAPNISGSGGSALRKFDADTLVAFLSDKMPDGLAAFGTMSEVTHSLSTAQESDVKAIAAYILDRAEEDPPADPPTVDDIPQDRLDFGKGVYEAHCQTCHGSDGMGVENGAPRLSDNGGVNAQEPNNVVKVLLQGIEPRKTYPAMPSFAEVLNDQEIADVSNYIRRSWDNEAPSITTVKLVEDMRVSVDTDEVVSLTTSCPAGQTDAVPAGLRSEVKALADRPVGEEQVSEMVSQFSSVVGEDLGYADKMAALTSVYCTALAEREPKISRGVFLERQLAFMNAVDDALVEAGAGPEKKAKDSADK